MSDAPSGREGSPFAKSKSSFTFRAEIPKKKSWTNGALRNGKKDRRNNFHVMRNLWLYLCASFLGDFLSLQLPADKGHKGRKKEEAKEREKDKECRLKSWQAACHEK